MKAKLLEVFFKSWTIHNQSIPYLIALPIFFNVVCCSFNPDEENFNNVQQNSDKPLLNLDNTEDTIRLFQPTKFELTVLPSGKSKYLARIDVDGKLISSPSIEGSNVLTFTLDPKLISNGVHNLTILILYPSGSGSLADKFEQEFVSSTRKYKLEVDGVPPESVDDLTIGITNGKLLLEWEKLAKTNFSHFMVVRYSKVRVDSVKIEDVNAVSFHDAEYTGGEVSYEVNVHGYGFFLRGRRVVFNLDPVKLELIESFTEPSITYSLKLNSPENQIVGILSYLSDVHPLSLQASTSFVPKYFSFGNQTTYSLRIRVKSDPENHYRYTSNVPVHIGKKIQPFTSIRYSQPYSAFFLLRFEGYGTQNNVTIYKMDEASFEVIDSLKITSKVYPYFTISRNSLHNYIVTDYFKVAKIDLGTLEVISEYDLQHLIYNPLLGYTQIVFADGSNPTDNNLLPFSWSASVVVNMNNLERVWYRTGPVPSLSADGEYLYLNGFFYQNQLANWNQVIGKINSSTKKVAFRGESDQVLAQLNNGQLFSYSLTGPTDSDGFLVENNSTVLSSFFYEANTDSFAGFNALSKKITHYSASDFSSREAAFPFIHGEKFFMIKDYVFNPDGYVIRY